MKSLGTCVRRQDACMWVYPVLCHPTPPSPSLPTLPACNVTIHNRCKDTLANCTKVKQKVRRHGGQRAGGEGHEYAVPSPCLSHSFPTLCASSSPPHPGTAQTFNSRPQPPEFARLPAYRYSPHSIGPGHLITPSHSASTSWQDQPPICCPRPVGETLG